MKVNLCCATFWLLTVLSRTDLIFGRNKTGNTDEIDFDLLHLELDMIDDSLVRSSMFKASQQVSRAIKRTNHRWRTENIWTDPHQLLQFFKQPPNTESIEMTRAGDIFDVTINMVTDRIRQQSQHHRSKRRVNETDLLSSQVISDLMSFSGCRANLGPVTCPTTCLARMYRTHSGVCNNEMHPYWGATNLPLTRWRPSQYENNFNSPKGWEEGRMYNNFELPLVRKVSNDVMSTMNADVTNDPDYSHLLVVWGQYVDHDMDFTPQSLSTSTFQGLTDCRQSCNNEFPCFPMKVPEDDPRITTRRCIPFFRSAAVCGSGHTSSLVNRIIPREQLNSINAFVDGSAVYGNSDSQNRDLRNLTAKEEGLMRVNDRFTDEGGREFLPFSKTNPCVQDRFDTSGEQIPCFDAGDKRVSEHQTLAIIHTIWVREHNRIARQMKVINPHWSGETIYQETRKIIGAYHQMVNWKEYLPKILGPSGMAMMGNHTGFQDDVDPSISNVFATAAFRFGHVTIHPEFRRLDENFENHPQFPTILLHEAFFSTWRVIKQGGADPIIRGLIGRAAKFARTDQLMHEELREKLFALQNQVALDLASLNLQRGRDHALPGYNDWRVECGLQFADNFSMLSDHIRNEQVRNELERLYGHPSNVDIWLGGLAEDAVEGSRVGPTFQCLIARQFKALRDGDRFYYRNPGQFTPGQLETLERLTFARLICETSGVQRVQRDVFALGEFPRDFLPCSEIPALDLEQWRENPEVGSCGVPPSIENGKWQKCGGNVAYFCNSGFTLDGAAEVMCGSDGQFTDVPSCVDVDECMTDNGNCEKTCRNSPGSFRCECPEGEVIDDDGKSCKKVELDSPDTQPVFDDSEHVNVEAIVIGTFFAVSLIGTVGTIVVVLHKYFKLQKLNENPMTKLTFTDNNKKQPIFDNGPPSVTSSTFDNPAMTSS